MFNKLHRDKALRSHGTGPRESGYDPSIMLQNSKWVDCYLGSVEHGIFFSHLPSHLLVSWWWPGANQLVTSRMAQVVVVRQRKANFSWRGLISVQIMMTTTVEEEIEEQLVILAWTLCSNNGRGPCSKVEVPLIGWPDAPVACDKN